MPLFFAYRFYARDEISEFNGNKCRADLQVGDKAVVVGAGVPQVFQHLQNRNVHGHFYPHHAVIKFVKLDEIAECDEFEEHPHGAVVERRNFIFVPVLLGVVDIRYRKIFVQKVRRERRGAGRFQLSDHMGIRFEEIIDNLVAVVFRVVLAVFEKADFQVMLQIETGGGKLGSEQGINLRKLLQTAEIKADVLSLVLTVQVFLIVLPI